MEIPLDSQFIGADRFVLVGTLLLYINRYPLHYVFPLPPSCLTVRAASVPSVRLSVSHPVSERVGEVGGSLLEAFSPGAPLFSPAPPWQMADLTHAYVKQFGSNLGLLAVKNGSTFSLSVLLGNQKMTRY